MEDKYIIVIDTICTGWTCNQNEDGTPVLFDTFEEAFLEIFSDSFSMISNSDDETLEEYGITPEKIAEMSSVLDELDISKMERFFEQNPECNYLGEFVVPESEYIEGRKTIVTFD